jgi:hypothetical protein
MDLDPSPTAAEASLMLRMRSEKPDPTDGKIVVAVNRDTYIGPRSDISPEALEQWWAECCSRVSRPEVDWSKAGGVMWDHLKIEVPAEWIASMMSLKSVDANMARAVMAALFSAVATTVGPVDIDSLLHGITTFVHTHPTFAEITKDAEWHLPYGENTAYCVSELGELDSNRT